MTTKGKEYKMGSNELWGYLRDSGVSEAVANRLKRLFEATKLEMANFVNLTEGQLMATYNKYLNPKGNKGLGQATIRAFEMLRARFRQMAATERRISEAEVKVEAETKEAAFERMKSEFLGREIDLKVMGEVVAGLSTMLETCDLKMILEVYGKKKGGR